MRCIMKKYNARDRSWPIYLISAGIVTILLLFVTSDENSFVNLLQVIMGGVLILYGLFKIFRKASLPITGAEDGSK